MFKDNKFGLAYVYIIYNNSVDYNSYIPIKAVFYDSLLWHMMAESEQKIDQRSEKMSAIWHLITPDD